MKSMYKNELATLMGVGPTTMTAYMRSIEDQLPHYRRSQKLLSPDQVEIVRTHFCIE